MCETVRTAQDRTPVLCEMCEMPIGIALRTAFRTARHGHSVSHSGAGSARHCMNVDHFTPRAAGRADASGSHQKALQAIFGRRTWGGSRADPEALVGRGCLRKVEGDRTRAASGSR